MNDRENRKAVEKFSETKVGSIKRSTRVANFLLGWSGKQENSNY